MVASQFDSQAEAEHTHHIGQFVEAQRALAGLHGVHESRRAAGQFRDINLVQAECLAALAQGPGEGGREGAG